MDASQATLKQSSTWLLVSPALVFAVSGFITLMSFVTFSSGAPPHLRSDVDERILSASVIVMW
jgi:hypothetical protein